MNVLLSHRRLATLLIVVAAFLRFSCASSAPPTSPTNDDVAPATSNDDGALIEVQRAVRPGKPGESSTVLSASDLVQDGVPSHTDADTRFMQGMIAHHAQALVMTAMVASRSKRVDLRMLAKRIDVSQESEIRLMQNWLRNHGEDVPVVAGLGTSTAGAEESASDGTSAHVHAAHAGHAGHAGHSMLMPGMLTDENLEELSNSTGDEFYKLFLQYMIGHHEGALVMVADLFSSDGGGQDTDIFLFASDVDIDQRIEIDRMHQMLESVR